MPDKAEPKSEFACRISLATVSEAGLEKRLAASEPARAALVRRLGVIDLPRFSATFRLAPRRGGRAYLLDAHLSAEVVQSCVVSLEPVAEEIEEDLRILFDRDMTPDPEMMGPPQEGLFEGEVTDFEPLDGGEIDIGEILCQFLALALDPYPRRPGLEANLPRESAGEEERPQASRKNPFSSLSNMLEHKGRQKR